MNLHPSVGIIVGPDSLLRKLKNLASRIINRFINNIGDILKIADYDKLFDGLYDGLRNLIPLYIFASRSIDDKIHYRYSIKFSDRFSYDLDSELSMGTTSFLIRFNRIIYLSLDISSLIELMLDNIKRDNAWENIIFIDKLVEEVASRSKANPLTRRILHISKEEINPLEKSRRIINLFLNAKEPIVEGSFSIDIKESWREPQLVRTLPLSHSL